MSAGLIAPALDLVFKVLDEARPYRFGYDDQLLRQVIDNNLIHFGEAKDIRFPHDIVFINRTAAGHYGNLSRLRAAAPWRRMVEARDATFERVFVLDSRGDGVRVEQTHLYRFNTCWFEAAMGHACSIIPQNDEAYTGQVNAFFTDCVFIDGWGLNPGGVALSPLYINDHGAPLSILLNHCSMQALYGNCIEMDSVSRVHITDCSIYSRASNGATDTTYNAINLRNSKNILISNNSISVTTPQWLNINAHDGCDSLTITGNKFYPWADSESKEAIRLTGTHNIQKDNGLLDRSWRGIETCYGTDSTKPAPKGASDKLIADISFVDQTARDMASYNKAVSRFAPHSRLARSAGTVNG